VGIVYQDVARLRPGTTYRVSAWAKAGPGTAEATAELSVHNGQGGGFRNVAMNVGSDWTELALLVIADELGLLRVHLVKGSNGGSIRWDDVSVSVVPLNGGFERGIPDPWTPSSDSIEVGTSHYNGNYSLATPSGVVFQDVSGLTPGRLYLV